MLKTLETRIPSKQILKHGFAITIALAVIQLVLDGFQNSFFLYMPPIGFALYLLVFYGIQPIIVGVLNIVLMHRFYDCEGWQIGFWFNGIFLLLAFSTLNVVLQTVTNSFFSVYVAVAEIILLAYPFGYLAKFSNRGSKKTSPQQPSTA